MSTENLDRPRAGRPADGLPRGGPALPGAVLMSDTAAGLLTVLAWSSSWASRTSRSATTWPGSTPRRRTGASSACSTGSAGSTRTPTRPGRRTPCRCSASRWLGAVPVRPAARPARAAAVASATTGVDPPLAWNTAASFVTNTNWQNYVGESTMGYLVQMAGLAVQNFASAAVGMAVAVALVRGFARSRTNRVGNFWVDLVRGCVRILLPLAVVATVAPDRRRAWCRTSPTPTHQHADRRHPAPPGRRRSPARRRSRSWAPTAAGPTTPTRRTRSRTRTRSPTSSRSSCCC